MNMLTGKGIFLLAIFVLIGTGIASAQCSYTSNGFIFLHPFFNRSNWVATLFTADVDAPEMCEMDIATLAIDQRASKGTVLFTTSDNKWYLSKAPLVDEACLCCRPAFYFEKPKELSLPAALQLQTAAPFALLNTQGLPSDSLYIIASSAEKAFLLHMHTASGAIGRVDTISGALPSGVAITGIWTEHDASGVDTACWITGSKGFAALFSVKNGTIGPVTTFTAPGEPTLLCAGHGYTGAADGSIFIRNGSSLTLDSKIAGKPIRSISNTCALGDSGTIVIRQNNSWKSFVKGTGNYRYGNLTGSQSGTTIELLDDKWQYTSAVLGDTPTELLIGSLGALRNDTLPNGTFNFKEKHATLTIPIIMNDPDSNAVIASFRVHHADRGAPDTFADKMLVPQRNPAAICTTQLIQLAGDTLSLLVSPERVSVAIPIRNSLKLGCEFWKWQYSTSLFYFDWNINDTLVVTAANRTFRILDSAKVTVTVTRYGATPLSSPENHLRFRCGRELFSLPVPKAANLAAIRLIDARGRCFWKTVPSSGSSTTFLLPEPAPGLHFVVLDYANGTRETRRILISGK